MLFPALRRLLSRNFPTLWNNVSRGRPRRVPYRPWLEPLEARLAPVRNITIVNGAGTATLADVDQFNDNPGADVTISADYLQWVTGPVVLRANNDIIVDAQEGGSWFLEGTGGNITLQAGRSIILTAGIGNFSHGGSGSLTLIANETKANGVVDAHRLPGAAEITGSGPLFANGDIHIALSTGAGLTNSTAGQITLGSRIETVNGGTVTLHTQTSMNQLVSQVGGNIFTNGLRLTGGSFSLTGDNLVNTLAANVSGSVSYTSAIPMTIGTVAGTSGVSTSGANTDITITVKNTGVFGADNLTVNGGATVQTAGGNILLQADDGVFLNAGSVVQTSTGTVTLKAGSNLVDGANNIHLRGTVISPAPVNVLGSAGSDTLSIYDATASLSSGAFLDGGAGIDVYGVAFRGVASANITVSDSGGNAGDRLEVFGTVGDDVIELNGNQVTRNSPATETIVYSGIEELDISYDDAESGNNTYNVFIGNLPVDVRLYLPDAPGSHILRVFGTPDPDIFVEFDDRVEWGNPVARTIRSVGLDDVDILGLNGNDSFTKLGGFTRFFGGLGNDTAVIQRTSADRPLFLDGGDGADSYTIQLGSLAGTVTVNDTSGTNTVQVVGTAAADTLTLTPSQLSTATGETINFAVEGAATTLAIDGGGGANQVTVEGGQPPVQLTVANVPLFVSAITAPMEPRQAPASISVSATFTDANPANSHTAVWDWGDGTTSAGSVVEANGAGSVTGNHTYAAAGVYTVKLTVTGPGGASAQSFYRYVVVYDPSAGYVTGGGWILSPAGAYVAGPTLTGRASFGFVSKYENGNTVPQGNTQFQLQFASFKFRSTAYEWLVISGARARYRGSGTINGAGNYGFLLVATDGQVSGGGGVDRFRIRIWDRNNNNQVVYDNQMGAAEDADPVTALGGGSIVIHKGSQSLLAQGGPPPGATAAPRLTPEQLQPLVREAVVRWAAAGITDERLSTLRQAAVVITDLSGSYLGLAEENVIWLDDDAAGWGWFVDATPDDDSEFTTPGDQGEQGRMDLLSVLLHEMGHLLGHEHEEEGVMAEALLPGTRLVPWRHEDNGEAEDSSHPILSAGGQAALAETVDVARLLSATEPADPSPAPAGGATRQSGAVLEPLVVPPVAADDAFRPAGQPGVHEEAVADWLFALPGDLFAALCLERRTAPLSGFARG